MHATRRLLAAALLALVPLAAGCGDDFAPPSLLDDLRVLALLAEPLEIGPDDEVRLHPAVYLPPGEALAGQGWSFCPFDLGAQSGYACLAPACELELPLEPDGATRARPLELALECAQALAAGGEPPPGLPQEVPERIEVRFRYSVRTAAGDERQAVLRLPLWTQGPPPAPNQAPRLAGVEAAGLAVEPGTPLDPVQAGDELELRVLVDEDSLDAYLDEAGIARTEEPLVSFYATAGRFAWDRDVGTDVRVTWRAEELLPGQTEVALWFVIRDLRGGQAVSGPYLLPLLDPP
ncbi:MAG TPA: hypothetical protein PK668_01500 [Myxococcota bacterium]|nr:hypothetical protein [Myxococcota bacterium]HRY96778.1 hypothetical protein [Myxococcota bacterium]HSA23500.1 hypothetical protein [Myxococcota bacterium]